MRIGLESAGGALRYGAEAGDYEVMRRVAYPVLIAIHPATAWLSAGTVVLDPDTSPSRPTAAAPRP